MLGAIIGDVIGSVYEWHNVKSTNFELFSRFTRFTDDTVLTVAVADAVLSLPQHRFGFREGMLRKRCYAARLKQYARWYPNAGYGQRFEQWAASADTGPYGSYGNGSAMRVSPIGFAFPTLQEVMREAKRSAVVTHNHRDAVAGAQAVAGAVFLARTGASKAEIRAWAQRTFRYNLEQRLDDIRPSYSFDPSCKGSVPQAIIAFLESRDYEEAIRLAISIGGDSDTIACMTGGIAHAFYKKLPADWVSAAMLKLDLKQRQVIAAFQETYGAFY